MFTKFYRKPLSNLVKVFDIYLEMFENVKRLQKLFWLRSWCGLDTYAVFTLERFTEVLEFSYLGKYFACVLHQLIPW